MIVDGALAIDALGRPIDGNEASRQAGQQLYRSHHRALERQLAACPWCRHDATKAAPRHDAIDALSRGKVSLRGYAGQ